MRLYRYGRHTHTHTHLTSLAKILQRPPLEWLFHRRLVNKKEEKINQNRSLLYCVVVVVGADPPQVPTRNSCALGRVGRSRRDAEVDGRGGGPFLVDATISEVVDWNG